MKIRADQNTGSSKYVCKNSGISTYGHMSRREKTLLSTSEQRVLRTFRQYLVTPGEMLCFSGPNLEQNKPTLELLRDKELLVKEEFQGGYSLTQAGFVALKDFE